MAGDRQIAVPEPAARPACPPGIAGVLSHHGGV